MPVLTVPEVAVGAVQACCALVRVIFPRPPGVQVVAKLLRVFKQLVRSAVPLPVTDVVERLLK